MAKKLNQEGSHIVAIVFVVLIIAVSAFAFYRILNNKKPKSVTQNNTSATKTEATAQKAEPTWQDAGFAVEGTYADADIVQVNDKQWRMYYAVQPEVANGNLAVYSSISSDGKTWTKEAGIRKNMATFPHVIKLQDGRYRMYYQSAAVIKSSISSDGLTFTEEPGMRIDKSNSENLVFDNVAAPTVIKMQDGTYMMVYRGSIASRYAQNVPNQSTQLLMMATSADGLTFTKKGIAIDSRNETLNGQLDGPYLVKWDDGSVRLYSTTYTGVYMFPYQNGKFGTGTLALAGEAKKDNMGFHGSPPGDPTLAKINGTWYMYYGGPREKNGINYAVLQ